MEVASEFHSLQASREPASYYLIDSIEESEEDDSLIMIEAADLIGFCSAEY